MTAIAVVGNAHHLPIRSGVVALTISSPPYALGVDYPGGDVLAQMWRSYIRGVARESYRVSIPNGRLALNVPLDTTKGGFRATHCDARDAVLEAVDDGWRYRSTIMWHEGNVSKSVARGSRDSATAPHVFSRAETILLFSKGPWKRERTGDDTIAHDDWLEWTCGDWHFPGESSRRFGHPAPFPEELPRRLIHLLSFTGDLVLDFNAGSHTVGAVAKRCGRRYVGVDREPLYAVIGRDRMANVPWHVERSSARSSL